nr:hypothetical protein [Chitinophaga sp. YR627]
MRRFSYLLAADFRNNITQMNEDEFAIVVFTEWCSSKPILVITIKLLNGTSVCFGGDVVAFIN